MERNYFKQCEAMMRDRIEKVLPILILPFDIPRDSGTARESCRTLLRAGPTELSRLNLVNWTLRFDMTCR